MLFTPSKDRRYPYRDPASLRVQRHLARTGLPVQGTRGSAMKWLGYAHEHLAYVRNRVGYHDHARHAEACIAGVRPTLRNLRLFSPLPA
jgi:hypothetical protein